MDHLLTRIVTARGRWRATAIALALVACGRADARLSAARAPNADSVRASRADSTVRARQDSINRAQPAYIVDSVLPPEEELRRFRADLPEAPRRLAGGASSRDELVLAFVRVLERADSVALRRLVMSRAEFAYLVYPGSPYTRAPYRQAPWLVWLQIASGNERGYARLLERVAGRSLGYAGYRCDQTPERQGLNLIWRTCTIQVAASSEGRQTRRLFGSILERDGQLKFVSLANEM